MNNEHHSKIFSIETSLSFDNYNDLSQFMRELNFQPTDQKLGNPNLFFIMSHIDDIDIKLTIRAFKQINGKIKYSIIRKEFGFYDTVEDVFIKHTNTDIPADINYTFDGKLKHLYYFQYNTAFREDHKPYYIKYIDLEQFEQYNNYRKNIALHSLIREEEKITEVTFISDGKYFLLDDMIKVIPHLINLKESDYSTIDDLLSPDELNLIHMVLI